MTDVVFRGGRILTMDSSRPDPEVVVVHDGRVAAVGDHELADAYPGADQVHLGGAVLAPGFIDAHNHLSIAALNPRWRDVAQVGSVDELLREVVVQAEAEPQAEWIRLHGWNEWTSGVFPSRCDLDGLGLDRPVIVAHYSLHQCVVSGAGLDALGIGRSTPDPTGGEIFRGPDGEATGLLLERAWSRAHELSLAAYADPDRWADHIAARARVLHAQGITAVHDAACSPAAEAVYAAMAAAGTLPVSVLALPHPGAILVNDQGARLDGPGTGEGDESFRVGALKLFADGGQAIALDVTVGGEQIRIGMSMEDVQEHALRAAERGWSLAIHAMGNRAVAQALGTFAAAARRRPDDDPRFRIEHVAVVSTEQVAHLADLGVAGVVQPCFVEHVGTITNGVSFDRQTWLAFATMAEAGVPLAGSSDDPCAPFPPLWGASRGATRRNGAGVEIEPHEAVPVEDWLRAYTVGSAHAGRQEHERGTITPGKRADLVVIEGPLEPDRARVAQTWVAGECVYGAPRAEDGSAAPGADRVSG